MYLYEKMTVRREDGNLNSVRDFVTANLNPKFELRPYQREAFENFITHFESKTCPPPTQVLFHMATGSGKTLIMAGLILYLYGRGYRNFLFFVNLTNILDKTRENFLNAASTKFLFAETITIDGKLVRLNVVENFQHTDDEAINICFTTTQALHTAMNFAREGSMTFDDFAEQKTVLISDEAHHLNVDTGKKISAAERENRSTWEQTVKHIFTRNAENVLLEFTATCDLENDLIRREYESKIVYDYPLLKFYNDRYSKEIYTFRAASHDRWLIALILSQYRLKIFQDHRLNVKPIVLFKAKTISECKAFMEKFIDDVKNLRGENLRELSEQSDDKILRRAFNYFAGHGISCDALAAELREDFSAEHCILVVSDSDAAKNQISLNTLENTGNPCRAIFEVKMLDEGWDVLNLFDIVRLYETRQSGGKKISPATIAEAQLIGRGARYCPFQLDDTQPKYQRKFDGDIANELRICETLYYHCQNDHRYVDELHKALHEIGLEVDRQSREYKLKDSFKRDELYRHGLIFVNRREEVDENFREIIPKKIYTFRRVIDNAHDKILNAVNVTEVRAEVHTTHWTIADIAEKNYSIVHKALMKFPAFKFAALKLRFKNLQSTRQFITDENFLGNIQIDITSNELEPSVETLHAAANHALRQIADELNKPAKTYRGTKKFHAQNISETFHDKTINFSDGHAGTSQNDSSIGDSQLDLSAADWFAYNDNFGTSEEKNFVEYFSRHVEDLHKIYSKIYLVRNERELAVYNFDDGARFEPDYVLFLQKATSKGFEQYQIFIEPKGEHLVERDAWKKDFLSQLKARAVPVKIFADDNDYKIFGLPFYNRADEKIFDSEFRTLMK